MLNPFIGLVEIQVFFDRFIPEYQALINSCAFAHFAGLSMFALFQAMYGPQNPLSLRSAVVDCTDDSFANDDASVSPIFVLLIHLGVFGDYYTTTYKSGWDQCDE